MAQRHPLWIPLMLIVTAGLPACGTTGKTSPFVLTLNVPKSQEVVSDILIASVAMESDAATHNALYVMPWGKFEPDDLRNIKQSLDNTIKQQLQAMTHSTKPRIDVHLVIRRYMVKVSNTAGAVLVTVTWAATESDGRLIYHEEFYASESVYLVGTIGLLKESIHKAIVRRIAITSLALATSSAAAKDRSTTFANTYISFEEAASRLPQKMISMRPFWFILWTTIPEVSKVQWNLAKPSQDFGWQEYLRKQYKSP